jgi:hypothetical protein
MKKQFVVTISRRDYSCQVIKRYIQVEYHSILECGRYISVKLYAVTLILLVTVVETTCLLQSFCYKNC